MLAPGEADAAAAAGGADAAELAEESDVEEAEEDPQAVASTSTALAASAAGQGRAALLAVERKAGNRVVNIVLPRFTMSRLAPAPTIREPGLRGRTVTQKLEPSNG